MPVCVPFRPQLISDEHTDAVDHAADNEEEREVNSDTSNILLIKPFYAEVEAERRAESGRISVQWVSI